MALYFGNSKKLKIYLNGIVYFLNISPKSINTSSTLGVAILGQMKLGENKLTQQY